MTNSKLIVGVIIVVVAVGGIFIINNNKSDTPVAKGAVIKIDTKNDSPANQKNTQSSPQTQKKNTQSSKINVTKPGKVIAYITDQYGKPSNTSASIIDALGEKADSETVQNGYFESKTVLPTGQYTIQVAFGILGGHYSETPVVKTFTLPPEGINLGTIIINKWGRVKFKVVNEVGTILRDAQELVTKCEITDEFIKNEDANRYPKNAPDTCATLTNYGVGSSVYSYLGETDYALLKYYPSGNYTIKISLYNYEPVEKSFSVNNRDVDLGTIVLKKK